MTDLFRLLMAKADLIAEAQEALQEIERCIVMEGGRIEVIDANKETGIIMVLFKSPSSGCPNSLITFKQGVETLLRQKFDWLKEVQSIDEPQEPDFSFRLADPDPKGGNDGANA